MLKIFLVDDEKNIRLGLKAIIERDTADCTVVGEASDGEEALKALQELNPDVLITDIKMPVMDGIELVKNLSGLNIKIIVLSGYDEYKYVREAMKSGVVDYLLKPVDKSALLELLDRIAKKIEDDLLKERQIEQFSQKIYDSIEILKEKFLIELIRGNNTDIQSQTKLNELTGSFSEVFIFSLINVDGLIHLEKEMYEKFNTSADNLLQQQITQILCTNITSHTFFTAEYEGKLAVLSTAEKNCIQTMLDEFCTVISVFKDEFHKKTGLTFTVGISETYYSIGKTCHAYQQALLALQGRFYYKKDSLIKYSSEKFIYEDMAENALTDNIGRLTNCIELGDPTSTKKELEIIFNRLCDGKISPDRFRELLRFIIVRISTVHQEFRQVVENCISAEFDLVYHIEKEDTLTELMNYMIKGFNDIVRHINTERTHRSKKIIEIAKDFINRNYNKDISLKSVAEQVHLSPNYFSDLFKNEIGKNFIDYLIEIRINAAKKLLLKPDTKVYEVGQLVGYDDPASFTRVFKKVVSVSPAEYKKLIN